MVARRLLFSFFWVVLLAACSDDRPSAENDAGGAAADLGRDLGRDLGDPSDVDYLDTDDLSTGCAFQSECDDAEICVDGECLDAPTCKDIDNWATCVEALEETHGEYYGIRGVCRDGWCAVACMADSECADGDVCSDNGVCIPFGGKVTGEHPSGDGAGFRAGVGNELMTYPIGVSMGGYGFRSSGDPGRYSDSLRASHGQMHGLFARAVALDDGDRQLMLVRLPIVLTPGPLHEAVARRLQETTGADWRDSLVISSTHTHSGPGRYWHLPRDASIDLGAFGLDTFNQQVFDWLVDSTVAVCEAALDDLSPARMGWEIVESFDTDDAIASDRWGESPPFDDNRLMLLRVDDATGTPRAVLFSFGVHGTFNESDYFTGDALSGMERALEEKLGRTYDRFVPTLFFNQNGGTMSPRGGRFGHDSVHRHESIGRQLAERIFADVEGVSTDADVELNGRTYRFPISYERIGYDVGQWGAGGLKTTNQTYWHGGLQCLLGPDDDYSTYASGFSYFCLPVHIVSQNRPPSLFYKSQMTALDLDGLTVITLPGEPSMEVGWQVLREARNRLGLDPADAWVWGFAQDHQFYLLPTNLRGELPTFPGISTPKPPEAYPDYAFSWRQGGYEAELSVWGPKFGDFMVERAIEALRMLREPSFTPDNLAHPAEFSPVAAPEFPIEESDQATIGSVIDDVPAAVERFQTIEFAWTGGDPGAEMPQAPLVVLEREEGADYVEVERASHRRYDNREPVMMTRLRKRGDDWQWVVRWEELHDFPLGRYRFRVAGHYQGTSGRTSYETRSRTFDLVPSDDIAVTVTQNGDRVTGTISYPEATPLDFVGTPDDPGAVNGTFRVRHPRVPTGVAPPVTAVEDLLASGVEISIVDGQGSTIETLTGGDVTLTTMDENVGGRMVPVTRFSATATSTPAGWSARVSVTDVHGNRTPD